MNYRKLGKSTLGLSEISFGCMSLKPHDIQSGKTLQMAVDGGMNYFDTADLYDNGENELLLGKALKHVRQDIVIGTKVGNQMRKDGSGWDWNPRKAYILEAVEASLIRLQTDYIDLYQLHGGTIDDPIDETIESFELLVEQGKIRYYGISSIRPNVIREYVSRSNIASVMMQYSLLDRRPEESCLELLEENGIGVLARGGLAKGLLVDKPAKEYLGYTKDEVEKVGAAIDKLSGQKEPRSKAALNYVLQPQNITSAVVGMRTVGQVHEALAVSESKSIPGQDLLRLNAQIPPKYYECHR